MSVDRLRLFDMRSCFRSRLLIPTSLALNLLLLSFVLLSVTPPPPSPTPTSVDRQREEMLGAVAARLTWTARGGRVYRVLYNYATADEMFDADDNITYATHATHEYLWHLSQVSERWRAPVTVAIYAPGEDFRRAAIAIRHLRICGSSTVRQLVSFHLFFEEEVEPDTELPFQLPEESVNCSIPLVHPSPSYRRQHNLSYPVNVARNIARGSAPTHHVLLSDVELYPSADIPTRMRSLLANGSLDSTKRFAYVLPVFEVEEEVEPPWTKRELVSLLRAKKAVPFHKHVCRECHQVPGESEWLQELPENGQTLQAFKIVRPRLHWEPIFVGSHGDPLYDDRLSWEGMSDKRTQMYEMCLLGYELVIVNDAFLVHAPGVKRQSGAATWRRPFMARQEKIKKQILRELHARLPPRDNCAL